MSVLVLNGGSSSWKSALFEAVAPDATLAVEPRASITVARLDDGERSSVEITLDGRSVGVRSEPTRGAAETVRALVAAYAAEGIPLEGIGAVGHRIVHGGSNFAGSVRIDAAVETKLNELESLAPLHNRVERAGIDGIRAALGEIPQFAVFDTAFHRTLVPDAYAYAGPYAWLASGIRRYGFHGVSVAYCSERLATFSGTTHLREPRAIVCHLGGGCSVTAVRAGTSVDTSMGYTPLDGTAMGTRSGAVDPGIVLALVRRAGLRGLDARAAADDVESTLERHSGLLGLSERSSDVRELAQASAAGDGRASLALDVFVRRLAATIGGMRASLDRLDVLAFTGGIGEHAAFVRERVCAKLGFAGIVLDRAANESAAGDTTISAATSPVVVVTLATREEWYVARECARVRVATTGP